MKYLINKTKLIGTIDGITSKSFGHRVLMLACFGDSVVDIVDLPICEDTICTMELLKKLGAKFETIDNKITRVIPIDRNNIKSGLKLNCGESGSTLRFILPILAMLGIDAEIDGSERLRERPIGALIETLKLSGAEFSADKLPLRILKCIKEPAFYVDASISSQFITGIMLAIAIAKRQSSVFINSKIVSKGYIDITINVLKIFNVNVDNLAESFTVCGNECKSPKLLKIEKDWSNNAVWLVAGVLNGEIEVVGMNLSSLQGDKNIFDILKSMSGDLTLNNENSNSILKKKNKDCGNIATYNEETKINVSNEQEQERDINAERNLNFADQKIILANKSNLKPLNIDIDCNIDLAPIISLCCALAKGESLLYNVGRLRDKESDRLNIIIETLKILGIETELIVEKIGIDTEVDKEQYVESLKIYGKNIEEIENKNFSFNSYNDHRFVMMQSIIGAIFGNTEIENPLAVNKSYPSFFEDFGKVGGKIEIIN